VTTIKAGILTYHFSDNYGALFQAYALREWFIRQGVDANFLAYHPAYVEEGGTLDRPWKPSLWRKNATIAYMWLTHNWRRLFGDKEQEAGFDQFRTEHLGIGSVRFRTPDPLMAQAHDLDLLVCGSDQIWNPSIQKGLDPVYFLQFPTASRVRKIAYAPSFGRSEIEPHYHAELGQLVRGLNGVSVREKSGVTILDRAGVPTEEVKIVPDPTILLGDFSGLIGDQIDEDGSVFCYALRSDEVIREVAEHAATTLGGPLYAPRSSRQRWRDIGKGVTPGPQDWLKMMASSSFVVSNSFHGIALSVILNKPFLGIGLPGKRANMNARVQNLLDQVGLNDRLVSNFSSKEIERLIASPTDWQEVNSRLDIMRKAGENYLVSHLRALTEPLQ
jgi:hypothetical protein